MVQLGAARWGLSIFHLGPVGAGGVVGMHCGGGVDETDVSYGVGILVLGEQPGALVKLRSSLWM